MLFTLDSAKMVFSSLIAAAMSKLENSFFYATPTPLDFYIVIYYKITIYMLAETINT